VSSLVQHRVCVGPSRNTFFHPLTLEYDYASDAAAYTSFDTGTHPNRPADLPIETLTMATVYHRAGFAVTESSGSGSVPIAEAGVGAKWSTDEMHDSMEAHFSQYAATAKWAAWVFFASLSTDGTSLGGIMFDSEEAPTRQGCAIFVDSFIAEEPAGDPDGAAFVQRMRFWCACHELGHCMNLAHSWQKDYPGYGNSWVPLTNDAESRSLMNYPFLVAGESTAYFADHEYRFDDAELVFLRHAPYQFIEPGSATWFTNHGFEQLTTPGAPLELTVRANRDRPVYEFLECVVLELKLKNVSSGPRIVDEKIFARGGATIIIQKKGGTARQHVPYARPIYRPAPTVLAAGESLFDSAFVSAGVNGFDLSEPGDYLIRCAVVVDGMTIVSEPLRVRILPPKGYDEERVAQDFFSRDVGRVLAFDGSRVLSQGLDVLREVVEVLPTRRVSRHARVALGSNLSQDKKVLRVNPDRTKRVEVVKAAPEESRTHLSKALLGDSQEIATTLSHVDYGEYMHCLIDLLERLGDKSAMAEAVGQLRGCLDRIGAPERVKARAKR
jgi:hypothetical protein